MKRKLIPILLIFAMLASGVQASALQSNSGFEAPEIGIMRYSYFTSITPKLTVSGTTASYSLKANGTSDVTSISATLQIQKEVSPGNYTNYGLSWTASSTNNSLSTSGTKTVDSGGKYRLKVTVTAYYKGGSSTETAYS